MIASKEIHLLSREDPVDERIARCPFVSPFLDGQNKRIDFAPDLLLLGQEQRIHLFDRQLLITGNHQNVHVAALVLFAAGERTKNERHGDLAGNGIQSAAKSLAQADGAYDELFERFVNRRVGVGPEKALPVAAKNPAIGEQFQFPLNGTGPAARPADDFTQVEGFIGAQIRQRQNCPARASKENLSRVGGRNHIEYNRTHFGYDLEAHPVPLVVPFAVPKTGFMPPLRQTSSSNKSNASVGIACRTR
jgi:hypothetical protein